MLVQLLALYAYPESHNAQRYLTDRRTDGRHDHIISYHIISDHTLDVNGSSAYICHICGRVCRARIGRISQQPSLSAHRS